MWTNCLFILMMAALLETEAKNVPSKRKGSWFSKGRLRDGGFLGHLGRSFKAAQNHDVEHWFKQKLNHFEPADETTWSQRYYVNAENYKPGELICRGAMLTYLLDF